MATEHRRPALSGDDAQPSTGSWLIRLLRRHPLGAFFLWFYTVGQALAWTPVLAAATGRTWPMQPFVVASTLIGLLLPALVITRLVDGPAGLRTLWSQAVRIRIGLGWYVAAFLVVPLPSLAIGVLLAGAPPDGSVAFLVAALGGAFLVPLAVTFLVNNWWEEVAWMGFVQARLQERRGPALAALLVAPLFSLQHSALVATEGLVNGLVLLILLALLAVPFRFLTGWLYNRTASLFLVGLVHAIGNAVAGGSGFQEGYLARLYPGNTSVTMAHLLAFAVLGSLVVVATRGRLGRRAAPAGRQAARTPL